MGRYAQSDPIGLEAGWNTYAYVGGNPLSNIDPDGLDCVSENGTTSCHFPNGPKFSVPTPEGFPKEMNRFNLLYHKYQVEKRLGCADSQKVMNSIINNPTPRVPSPATQSGTRNNASVLGFNNYVTSYLTTDLSSGLPLVVNITGSRGLFGPGYVARMVHNGKAITYGEGTNWKQSEGLFGITTQGVANEAIWGSQMSKFINQCGCQK